jgi:hypothetical protein
MEKALVLDYEIAAKITWQCPHCKAENKEEYSPGAYSSIAEDPIDVTCSACGEFSTLNF